MGFLFFRHVPTVSMVFFLIIVSCQIFYPETIEKKGALLRCPVVVRCLSVFCTPTCQPFVAPNTCIHPAVPSTLQQQIFFI